MSIVSFQREGTRLYRKYKIRPLLYCIAWTGSQQKGVRVSVYNNTFNHFDLMINHSWFKQLLLRRRLTRYYNDWTRDSRYVPATCAVTKSWISHISGTSQVSRFHADFIDTTSSHYGSDKREEGGGKVRGEDKCRWCVRLAHRNQIGQILSVGREKDIHWIAFSAWSGQGNECVDLVLWDAVGRSSRGICFRCRNR